MERRSRRHQTVSFVQPGKCNIETVAEPKLVTRTSVGLKKKAMTDKDPWLRHS